MKMLVHREAVATADPFNLDLVKQHLRILHDDEDLSLINMAHTAAAEIEHFAQIALLTQTIRVTVFNPDQTSSWVKLPIGPADEDNTPTVTVDGEPFTAFTFAGGGRPSINWGVSWYDLPPPDRLNIEYTAGFGDTAADIPRDLAQAVMDQTALHFDARSPMDRRDLTTSPHMARIGARYRGVQA